MDAADQSSHSPLLAGLLLIAGGAFWTGILIAAGGGNAFLRAIVTVIVALSLAGLMLVYVNAGRDASETLLWALLGFETALALLTVLSLTIFGWIPVVLTALAIGWWPRRPGERAITPLRLAVQIIAFLVVLAPFFVPAL